MKFVRLLISIVDIVLFIPIIISTLIYLNIKAVRYGIVFRNSFKQILKAMYSCTKDYIRIYFPKLTVLAFTNLKDAIVGVFA